MNTPTRPSVLALLAALAVAPDALAQEGWSWGREARDSPALTREALSAQTWPVSFIHRPLLLGPDMFQAQLSTEASISSEEVFEPFSVAPDLWYGVAPDLTVGIAHSTSALSLVGAGNGVCLAGENDGCDTVYNNLYLDLIYRLGRRNDDRVEVAARGGLLAQTFDPLHVIAKVGLVGRWTRNRFAVIADPWIGVAITDRGDNQDLLNLPVTGYAQVTQGLVVFLGSGLNGTLQDPDDFLLIPLRVGALYSIDSTFDLSASYGIPGLAGSDIVADADARVLTLSAVFRG
jgi:hypothetical protein